MQQTLENANYHDKRQVSGCLWTRSDDGQEDTSGNDRLILYLDCGDGVYMHE